MGVYAEYLDRLQSLEEVTAERKRTLRRISDIRGGRNVLVFAANLSGPPSHVGMDRADVLAFRGELEGMQGDGVDVVLEAPGGLGDAAEYMAALVRKRHKNVGVIIPGYAKGTGTVFAMAADEIIMGHASSLGPIDAELRLANGKPVSAGAFLDELKKIKSEAARAGRLAPAYVPILQDVSTGDAQNCENILSHSLRLVSGWLAARHFKSWTSHSDGRPVTAAERQKRADEVAAALCSRPRWLTRNRPIKIDDLEELCVKVTNYDSDPGLRDCITRYYALLRISFEISSAHKILETVSSQTYRFSAPARAPRAGAHEQEQKSLVGVSCIACGAEFAVQVNWESRVPPDGGAVPYSDPAACPSCGAQNPLGGMLLQLERLAGKKAVV